MRRLVFWTAVLFAFPALGQGDQMLIDFIDVSKYEKTGVLRFYVDIIDQNNQVVPEQEKSKLRFYINDDPINDEIIENVDLQLFKDIGEPLALGILFTNYGGFIPKSVGEPSLFSFSKTGIVELLKELTNRVDYCGIWLYNEEGNDLRVPFTSAIGRATNAIEELPEDRITSQDDEETDSGKVQAPKFYNYLDQVVTKMGEMEDLPRRRILLVISDGVGEFGQGQRKRIDRSLQGTIERANDANIKIYAFGAMLQEDAFLTYLSQAAERTYGVYYRIPPAEPGSLESKIRQLAPQIKKQYVIDVTVPGLPSEEKVKFRIDGTTPNGEKVSGVYPKAIKLPDTPTNWGSILTWIGIGLLCLFGLIFFIWIIKKIVAWRRDRPEPEEEYEEEEEYTGPDRGKLRVRTGPLAGETFHLIEDITTIGSIDGNHVVLYDDGVSKRHAGIKIEEMRYELADFGSTNGTWVNGRKINKQFLRDGDQIRIGNTEMEFTLK